MIFSLASCIACRQGVELKLTALPPMRTEHAPGLPPRLPELKGRLVGWV